MRQQISESFSCSSPQNLWAPCAPRLTMYWRKTCLSVTSLRDLSLAACRRMRLNSLGLQSTITVCLVGLYAARIGKSTALSGAEKLEVGVSRVVVRRPFQDSVQHPKTALAGEAVVSCPGWIFKGAILGRGAQVRNSGLPRGACPEVAAEVRENVA